MAYDDYSIGYAVVKEHFGALRELSEREDNWDCLQELQQQYIEAEQNSQNSETEGSEMLQKKKTRTFIRKMTLGILSQQEDFWGDRSELYTKNVKCIRDKECDNTNVIWNNIRAVRDYFISIFNTGGIAVYYNTYGGGMGPASQYTHSAIVLANTYGLLPQEYNLLKSKWGECAVYTHAMSNCPYYYVFYAPMSQPQPCDIVYYN